MLMIDKLPKYDKTNSCCDKMSKSGRIFRISTKKQRQVQVPSISNDTEFGDFGLL